MDKTVAGIDVGGCLFLHETHATRNLQPVTWTQHSNTPTLQSPSTVRTIFYLLEYTPLRPVRPRQI